MITSIGIDGDVAVRSSQCAANQVCSVGLDHGQISQIVIGISSTTVVVGDEVAGRRFLAAVSNVVAVVGCCWAWVRDAPTKRLVNCAAVIVSGGDDDCKFAASSIL